MRAGNLRIAGLAAAVAVLGALPVRAADWYVDCAAGLDTNPGTTAASPFKTIATGIAAAAAGDTVRVAAGICDSTSQSFPVAMKAQVSLLGAGRTQTFLRNTAATSAIAFGGPGPYPRSQMLAGFDIETLSEGVYVSVGMPTIRANVIHEGQVGVNVLALDPAGEASPLIEDNVFHDLGEGAQLISDQAAVRAVVRRNWFLGSKIFAQAAVEGQTRGPVLELTLENNVAVNSFDGFSLIGGVHRIVNNTFAATENGLSLDPGIGTIVVSDLVNNIFATSGYGVYEGGAADSTVTRLANNDFFSNRTADYVDFVLGNVPDPNTLAGASGNVKVDPSFVNAASDDYHIRPSSACRDAGTAAGSPGDDIDGDARGDGQPDIGADEVVALSGAMRLFRASVASPPFPMPGWKTTYLPLGPTKPIDAGWPRMVSAPGTEDDLGIVNTGAPLVVYRLLDANDLPVGNVLRAVKRPGTANLQIAF